MVWYIVRFHKGHNIFKYTDQLTVRKHVMYHEWQKQWRHGLFKWIRQPSTEFLFRSLTLTPFKHWDSNSSFVLLLIHPEWLSSHIPHFFWALCVNCLWFGRKYAHPFDVSRAPNTCAVSYGRKQSCFYLTREAVIQIRLKGLVVKFTNGPAAFTLKVSLTTWPKIRNLTPSGRISHYFSITMLISFLALAISCHWLDTLLLLVSFHIPGLYTHSNVSQYT